MLIAVEVNAEEIVVVNKWCDIWVSRGLPIVPDGPSEQIESKKNQRNNANGKRGNRERRKKETINRKKKKTPFPRLNGKHLWNADDRRNVASPTHPPLPRPRYRPRMNPPPRPRSFRHSRSRSFSRSCSSRINARSCSSSSSVFSVFIVGRGRFSVHRGCALAHALPSGQNPAR